MPLAALGLVLASALLHATWNAIVKAGDDRLVAAWATTAAGAFLGIILLAAGGLPSAASLAFVGASGVVHVAYIIALTRAYDDGDLSLVYPVARGIAPVVATAGAMVAFGENLPGPAYAGVGLIALGVLLLGALSRRVSAPTPGRALAWSLATALCTGVYTLIDRQGVRLTSPVSYISALFPIHASLFCVYVTWRRRVLPWRLIARNRLGILGLSGAFSLGAYLLVLSALAISRVGYIAALRETSVLIAAWVGWRHLGDLQGPTRLASSGIVAAGLVLLVAAR
jgi:uncharacterized membrane protein